MHLYLFSMQLLDLFITSEEASAVIACLGEDGALATSGETMMAGLNFSGGSGIIWHVFADLMTCVTAFVSLDNPSRKLPRDFSHLSIGKVGELSFRWVYWK